MNKEFLLYSLYIRMSIQVIGLLYINIEHLENRLSSESLFVFRNDLYKDLLYYMYTCCYTKME